MKKNYKCPSCRMVLKSESGVAESIGIKCPHCGTGFVPEAGARSEEAEAEPTPPSPQRAESLKIQERAEVFCGLAAAPFILAIIVWGAELATKISGDADAPKSLGLGFVGWTFLTSGFFYLIGQLLHIRALLSKK